jgi:hypothetical protein
MPAEAADSVNDPRAALHEDLRPDPPTIGDGRLSRALQLAPPYRPLLGKGLGSVPPVEGRTGAEERGRPGAIGFRSPH